MDDEIENSPQCYSFPAGFRDLWKRYKSLAARKDRDDQHKHKNAKMNDGHDGRVNSHAFSGDTFKAATHNKTRHVNHILGSKEVGQTCDGGEGLNGRSYKHSHTHPHPNCFKALILPKKKPIQSANLAREFPKTSSMERTRSMDRPNSVNKLRAASMSRSRSIGSRNYARNGSLVNSRSLSVSRSGHIIMFSSSRGKLKPPPVEHQLECSLEELCHGCVRHINIFRNVYITTGQITQQEEVLKVDVKPGWKSGTEITFTGSMSEKKEGEVPGDVIFVITQKHHPLFRRIEDNLELEIQVPLVDALTGCTLSIPLLGREAISVSFDDIIYPGYQKIIQGQGMPNQKKPHLRGDLNVSFIVEFPTSLTVEQRSEIFRILTASFD